MKPLRKDILVLKKLGFSTDECLEMSRGMVRSYDRAYDELSNPPKPGSVFKVRRDKGKK